MIDTELNRIHAAPVLSDEYKDYVDCASDALKNKRKWEVYGA